MRKVPALIVVIVAAMLSALITVPPTMAATVGNSHPQTGQIVNDDPANFTPHILNGTVYSIVQVGNMVVVGGDFTQVRQTTTSPIMTRNRVFAFNATTGEISTDFNPNPNNVVYKVQAAADGTSVYVGGRFSSAYGVSMPSRLFKADVASGDRDPTFRPGTISGDIRDLEVIGTRLWLAGKFTHIAGVAQQALGTINATTGVKDSYFTGVIAGTHRNINNYPNDRTNVLQISSNPANTQLVAVGNFTSVNGQSRSQIAQFDISGASYSLAPWYTTLFTSNCSGNFETIMTDVEYSPDGSFFAVSTTAAWGGTSSATGGNGCDVVARFESSSTSSNSKATWTAYTGGDSTWTIEVTDNVVYAGGHQSWQNNPMGANVPAQGAVPRPGIAGLNAVNGMAWSWNPTRTRGVGVQDMLATSQGLWVGSDTDRIGNYEYHARIALMPLAGGKTLPVMSNPTLPASMYSVASGGSQLTRRDFNGAASSVAPSSVTATTNAPAWGSTVGAFMSNGTLYTAASNGTVTKRSFNGSSYGSSSVVDAADILVRQTDWHNTDVPSLTSLFFYNGEMFFTRSGQSTMFRRGFETESDIVGQQRFPIPAVSGISFSGIRGAFVANDKFYYSNTTGQLFRADWSGRSPVGGTSVQISGPGKDSRNWASKTLFSFEGVATPPVNHPPTAAATVTCTGLSCSYNGTASDDPDGDTLTYAWDFDDGNNGSGATTTHTYAPADAGPHTVTLTVTDPEGESDSVTSDINPQPLPNQPPTAAATITCELLVCEFNASDSDDPDGTIDSYAWDFDDDVDGTGSGETATHTFSAAGPRTVSLTVTDNDGDFDTQTFDISPTDVASPVDFVAAASTVGNRLNHTVPIPAAVEEGDALVLFFAANTTTPTYAGPAGWTEIGSVGGSGTAGRAYAKVASAADAATGATVRVVSSGYAKSQITVAAYAGTDATAPVAASASGQDAGGANHTSPTVTAPDGNNTLVTFWADESSATSGWTIPGTEELRNTLSDSGSGHMSGVTVDSSNVTGSTGGLTATANSSSSRGVSFSVVLH